MVIYNLLIQPLVLIVDILFVSLYEFFGVPAAAVIYLSIAVNLLALPLYRQADRIQKSERLQHEKMKPWVEHIRKNFSGDERYMMLSAYYKVEHYSPTSVLKESFPLLLQVPIFIAAYQYLSNTSVLSGASFGPITDLGSPDGLLTVGRISLNLLPVLMTVLNLASGYVYSRRGTLREKLQIIVIALLFLVLLYDSPAGLVLYWTTSQVFSLFKNVVLETNALKDHKVVLALSTAVIVFSALGVALQVIATPAGLFTSELLLLVSVAQVLRIAIRIKREQVPAAFGMLRRFGALLPETEFYGYFAVCLCCALLFGICIPSSVLSASATEFVDTTTGRFLWELLAYPAMVYFGLFVIWGSIFFYFTGRRGRRVLFSLVLACLGTALLNYFVFDVKPGFYYADLSFDGELDMAGGVVLLNVVLCVILMTALLWFWKKQSRLLISMAGILAVALMVLGGYNVVRIPPALHAVDGAKTEGLANDEDTDGLLPLSKTENNVIVFMLDRALGAYAPFIFNEQPELKEAFDGFVFYPNTVSFGSVTDWGAPPLYGGYEYTPDNIVGNAASSLDDQRKEALRVLPVLFSKNGYRTTVTDPALFDTSNYSEYPEISAMQLTGKFSGKYSSFAEGNIRPTQRRNFLMFSIYKTAPLFLRDAIYDDGGYIAIGSKQNAFTQAFIDNYTVLRELPNLMSGNDDGQGSFLFLQNSTTHEPVVLEAPDYEVDPWKTGVEIPYGERTVDGRTLRIGSLNCWKHYCVNALTFRELAVWINRLRELGVYDNTKIVLVADHGATLGPPQFDDWVLSDGYDVECVNPLLMVKDYGAHGEMTSSKEFMTNADVASIATQNAIDDPENPFTGNGISNTEKERGVLVMKGFSGDALSEEEKKSLDKYIWLKAKDDIFDLGNWELLAGEEIR